jgi:hypothetical protein
VLLYRAEHLGKGQDALNAGLWSWSDCSAPDSVLASAPSSWRLRHRYCQSYHVDLVPTYLLELSRDCRISDVPPTTTGLCRPVIALLAFRRAHLRAHGLCATLGPSRDPPPIRPPRLEPPHGRLRLVVRPRIIRKAWLSLPQPDLQTIRNDSTDLQLASCISRRTLARTVTRAGRDGEGDHSFRRGRGGELRYVHGAVCEGRLGGGPLGSEAERVV